MYKVSFGRRYVFKVSTKLRSNHTDFWYQINQVLAKHYGFTDEALDFIINYNTKYRMGRVADSGEEAAE